MSQTGQSAYDQAIRWLSRRAYGQVELTRRLAGSGFEAESIDPAIARCKELGYLDDRAFAESRARVRFGRGYGAGRVRAELRFLGIDAEMIESALEAWQAQSETNPKACALRVLEKRFGPLDGGWLDFKERQRYYGFLARRGFEFEVIDAVLSGER